jgi:hypothetical protein
MPSEINTIIDGLKPRNFYSFFSQFIEKYSHCFLECCKPASIPSLAWNILGRWIIVVEFVANWKAGILLAY